MRMTRGTLQTRYRLWSTIRLSELQSDNPPIEKASLVTDWAISQWGHYEEVDYITIYCNIFKKNKYKNEEGRKLIA
jgi:hypothetical protein